MYLFARSMKSMLASAKKAVNTPILCHMKSVIVMAAREHAMYVDHEMLSATKYSFQNFFLVFSMHNCEIVVLRFLLIFHL